MFTLQGRVFGVVKGFHCRPLTRRTFTLQRLGPDGRVAEYGRPLPDWESTVPRISGMPFVFTASVILGSFTGAAWLMERRRKRQVHRIQQSKLIAWPDLLTLAPILTRKYLGLTRAQQTVYPIVGLCSAVFLAWQVPFVRFRAFMERNFMHRAMLPRLVQQRTMLLSALSHRGLLHLSFNMLAFVSFAPAVYGILNRTIDRESKSKRFWPPAADASVTPLFVAFLVSAAAFASFSSTVWSYIGFALAKPSSALYRRALVPALGASGVVYSLFALTALDRPKAKVSILFLPFLHFDIKDALYGMLAFDALGLVLGWSVLGHAAHLGGALWGWLWFKYGPFWFAELRRALR